MRQPFLNLYVGLTRANTIFKVLLSRHIALYILHTNNGTSSSISTCSIELDSKSIFVFKVIFTSKSSVPELCKYAIKSSSMSNPCECTELMSECEEMILYGLSCVSIEQNIQKLLDQIKAHPNPNCVVFLFVNNCQLSCFALSLFFPAAFGYHLQLILK